MYSGESLEFVLKRPLKSKIFNQISIDVQISKVIFVFLFKYFYGFFIKVLVMYWKDILLNLSPKEKHHHLPFHEIYMNFRNLIILICVST